MEIRLHWPNPLQEMLDEKNQQEWQAAFRRCGGCGAALRKERFRANQRDRRVDQGVGSLLGRARLAGSFGNCFQKQKKKLKMQLETILTLINPKQNCSTPKFFEGMKNERNPTNIAAKLHDDYGSGRNSNTAIAATSRREKN